MASRGKQPEPKVAPWPVALWPVDKNLLKQAATSTSAAATKAGIATAPPFEAMKIAMKK
jgi:hypothetical protein